MDELASLELDSRVGLHAGEIELIGEDVGGVAVYITERVMSPAGPGDILVSSTVRELAVGSGIHFEDRSEHELRGVPDLWSVYRAKPA